MPKYYVSLVLAFLPVGEHASDDLVVHLPQLGGEVNGDGIAGEPGGALALETVHLVHPAVAHILGGDGEATGAMVGPLDDLEELAVQRGDGALIGHLLEGDLGNTGGGELAVEEVGVARGTDGEEIGVISVRGEGEDVGELEERRPGVGDGGGGHVVQLDALGEGGVRDDGSAVAAVLGLGEEGGLLGVEVEGNEVLAGRGDSKEEFLGLDDLGALEAGDEEGDTGVGALRGKDDGVGQDIVAEEGGDAVIELLVAALDVVVADVGEEDLHPAGGEGLEEGEGHDVEEVVLGRGRAAAGGLVHAGEGGGDVVLGAELADGEEEVLRDVGAGGEVPEAGLNHLVVALADEDVVELGNAADLGAEVGGNVAIELLSSLEVDVLDRGLATGSKTRGNGQVESVDEIHRILVGEEALDTIFTDGTVGLGVIVCVDMASLCYSKSDLESS